MKKILNINLIRIVLAIILVSFICCIFSGCANGNNSDTQQSDHKKEEIIELNISNFEEYFVLQEEIITYNREDYVKNLSGFVGGETENYTRANQTTKISIILLKENISFNNVELTIKISNGWQGVGGTLKLAYNGTGLLTLSATYNAKTYLFNITPNAHYAVNKIKGNITLK